MVAAAILLGKLRHDTGDATGAVGLLDAVVDRYGKPGVPDHEGPSALAQVNAAWVMEDVGEFEASIERYERAIGSFAGSADSTVRRQRARAMARQAYLLYEAERLEEASVRCHELPHEFACDAGEDAEIADHVAWAREMLEYDEGYRRGRFAKLRNGSSGAASIR